MLGSPTAGWHFEEPGGTPSTSRSSCGFLAHSLSYQSGRIAERTNFFSNPASDNSFIKVVNGCLFIVFTCTAFQAMGPQMQR